MPTPAETLGPRQASFPLAGDDVGPPTDDAPRAAGNESGSVWMRPAERIPPGPAGLSSSATDTGFGFYNVSDIDSLLSTAHWVDEAVKEILAQPSHDTAAAAATPAAKEKAAAQAASLQAKLNTAVADEITARVGAKADDAEVARVGRDIVARYDGNPAAQRPLVTAAMQARSDRQAQAQAEVIVATARAHTDGAASASPFDVLRALNEGYANATQDVKDAILRNADALEIIDNAVTWANAPLTEQTDDPEGRRPWIRAADAIHLLDQATLDLDKGLAAAVVGRAIPGYEALCSTEADHEARRLGIQAMPPAALALSHDSKAELRSLAARIAGTPPGDKAISRFAALAGPDAFGPELLHMRAAGDRASADHPDTATIAGKPATPSAQQEVSARAARVDEAVKQIRLRSAVASPDGATTLGAAAQAASLQKELNSAVNAEITARVGAKADDADVVRAGRDIAARHAGDPAAQYFVTSAVTQVRSDRHDAVIPLADLIRYVKEVERGYPNDTPEQILTRIRTQYYHGIKFEMAIPDAPYLIDAGTHRVYTGGEIHDTSPRRLERSAIGPVAYRHLTARSDDEPSGNNPSVVMPNGDEIDIGHVLVGLDALLHPATRNVFAHYGVPNIDPSSWVGDLGAASVWMSTHERDGKPDARVNHPPKTADLDAYYKMSAPEEDLFADVDSFGVKAQWDAAPGQKLSQALAGYYEGTGATSARQRFQIFCSANQLTYTRTGNTIQWDPALSGTLAARIDHFSDLYAAGNLGAAWNWSWGATPSHEAWPHTPEVAQKFLAWVKTKLEAEFARSGGS